MSRVLITGATGILGGWLVSSLLDSGHKVTSILNPSSKLNYREGSISRVPYFHHDAIRNMCSLSGSCLTVMNFAKILC